jgi:excisionase family DNA binding protein
MRSYLMLDGNSMRDTKVEIVNYTISETCKKLRCCKATLYTNWREGKGPHFFRMGKKVLISRDALAEYISQLEMQTAEARAK